jgi:uncharacterized protein YndB with AHSA1/START domain
MAEPKFIEVKTHISARATTVFRFLSDPQSFAQWMGPGSGIVSKNGGEISVRYPNGDIGRGEVLEVVANRKLVFSWGYEGGKNGLAPGSSRVTIELVEEAGGTVVTLRHEGLDAVQRQAHSSGWNYYLGSLSAKGADRQFATALPQLIATYVASWNETDSRKRWQLLESCWEPEGTYRDPFGSAEGVSAIDQYIAGAQMFAPGRILRSQQVPARTQGYARFLWTVSDPKGQALHSGMCFGKLRPSNRFIEVVGFWN